jgi:AbrB family looped-hinge helix DNA binding protein
MAVATLTEKGQVVIPAKIRARYELTPGTRVEFVDDGDSIRLLVRRRAVPTDAAKGYGLIKVARRGVQRRLSDFDPAATLERAARRK